MPTVMVTFVQATCAVVTFVHISNISAVTGPILIKLFGPNFFGVKIFVDQNVLWHKFCMIWVIWQWTKIFLDKTFSRQKILLGPKVFKPEILLDPKKILNSNFLHTQNCFRPTNFFRPKIFLSQNLFEFFFRIKIRLVLL